jgi:hypothetical protein
MGSPLVFLIIVGLASSERFFIGTWQVAEIGDDGAPRRVSCEVLVEPRGSAEGLSVSIREGGGDDDSMLSSVAQYFGVGRTNCQGAPVDCNGCTMLSGGQRSFILISDDVIEEGDDSDPPHDASASRYIYYRAAQRLDVGAIRLINFFASTFSGTVDFVEDNTGVLFVTWGGSHTNTPCVLQLLLLRRLDKPDGVSYGTLALLIVVAAAKFGPRLLFKYKGMKPSRIFRGTASSARGGLSNSERQKMKEVTSKMGA